MLISYKLKKDSKLSDKERQEILESKKSPIVFDDDCPELDTTTSQGFVKVGDKIMGYDYKECHKLAI